MALMEHPVLSNQPPVADTPSPAPAPSDTTVEEQVQKFLDQRRAEARAGMESLNNGDLYEGPATLPREYGTWDSSEREQVIIVGETERVIDMPPGFGGTW